MIYLPGYIPPKSDELFSSWFLRLSKAHHVKSYSFSNFYLEGLPIWNRDIDKRFQPVLNNFFFNHTPLNLEQIQAMFLESYNDILWEGKMKGENSKVLLSAGINHRKRKLFGIVCCPNCLDTDPIPYFRKHWRLTTSIICVKCRCWLIDRCTRCLSSIEYHRLEIGHRDDILEEDLSKCWNCKKSLGTEVSYVSTQSREYKYQLRINNLIRIGYNEYSQYSFTVIDSYMFFLRQFISSSHYWPRIRIVLENYFKVNFNAEFTRIAFIDLELRRKILPLVDVIMSDYPKTFIRVFEGTDVRLSDFSKDWKNLPYWIRSIVNEIN